MAYKDIIYETGDGRATITINRPERLNAFRMQTIIEMGEAFERAADDESVGVVILTGAGERAFCAGSDLKYRVSEADQEDLRAPGKRGAHILDRCWKPIIAAVNGYAVGGGLELAMRCDILIAAENALQITKLFKDETN